MNSQVVKLQVTASIPIDCEFWPEDYGWKGLCKSPSAMVRGSSFEDAKKKMATELEVHIALDGASVRQDVGSTRAMYRKKISTRSGLTGQVAAPRAAHAFLDAVRGAKGQPLRSLSK